MASEQEVGQTVKIVKNSRKQKLSATQKKRASEKTAWAVSYTHLKEQVYSSVLWEQSVRAMIADGVDVFVEIGPGKTLSGFMRKIDRNVKMFRIGTMEDIDKTVEAIKEL